MNVTTIELPKAKAVELFNAYRSSVRDRRTDEDRAIMRGYKELAKGRAIIDLAEAMKTAGLDHESRPRLGIGRADLKQVFFEATQQGGGIFKSGPMVPFRSSYRDVRIPNGTFPATVKCWRHWEKGELSAQIPLIPPHLRPDRALSHYHVLWEPDWQREPPRDPFLCRRLAGMLFVVVAQWDLTDLERAVMRGRIG